MPDGIASTPLSVPPSKPCAAPSKKLTAEPITTAVPDLPTSSCPSDHLKEIPWVNQRETGEVDPTDDSTEGSRT